MIDAKKAKEQTKKRQKFLADEKIKQVSDLISSKIKDGKDEAFADILYDENIQQLKKLGYKIISGSNGYRILWR